MLSIGQVVYSKSGRDKGGIFFVVGLSEGYAFIADGDKRKLDKPKRKKPIHLQPVNSIDADIKKRIENNEYLLDSDLRSSLKKYKER